MNIFLPINSENLFSETTKNLKKHSGIFAKIDDGEVEKYLKIFENALDTSYNSKDEDIEDLCDIIQFIHMETMNAMKNSKISNGKLNMITQMRLKGKKTIKKKYRDFKYDGRTFWNFEEAHQQFSEFMTYVWKPSIVEYKNTCAKYRG